MTRGKTGAKTRGNAGRPAAARLTITSLCLVAAACQGSGFSYVGNSQEKTYFRVPEEWELFDQKELAGGGEQVSFQGLGGTSGQWVVAFDSSPSPSVDNVLDTSAEHPTGYAQVRPLSNEEHESFSLTSLRNAVIPIDELGQTKGKIRPVSEEEILLDNGVHGTRLVTDVKVGEEFFTVDQTALVDAGTHKLYLLVLGCMTECYKANRNAIDLVADSWTVEESS